MKTTTLNIGPDIIRYVVFRDATVVDWGTLPLAGTVRNGLIQDPEMVGERLKPAFATGICLLQI